MCLVELTPALEEERSEGYKAFGETWETEGNHPEKRLKVIYMALFWDLGYSAGSQEYGREKAGK